MSKRLGRGGGFVRDALIPVLFEQREGWDGGRSGQALGTDHYLLPWSAGLSWWNYWNSPRMSSGHRCVPTHQYLSNSGIHLLLQGDYIAVQTSLSPLKIQIFNCQLDFLEAVCIKASCQSRVTVGEPRTVHLQSAVSAPHSSCAHIAQKKKEKWVKLNNHVGQFGPTLNAALSRSAVYLCHLNLIKALTFSSPP